MVNADFSAPTRRGGDGAVFSSGSDIKSNSCLVGLCLWDYQGKDVCDSMDNQLWKKEKTIPFRDRRKDYFLSSLLPG
ncbi:hypothetical protein [Xenorhabdus nematophila]|uniref:hypothetical protein n=1 Tax=Xenorhabdus nematophila TaxID=628 RepID=UPI0008FF9923|nr:hypothetical protein [Xenorhabdus nematophila]